MSVEARLAPDSFDPADELAAFTSAAAGAGAVVSFVGLARGQAARRRGRRTACSSIIIRA